MAKYCIFRLYKKNVTYFESYDDWEKCNKRCTYLNEVAIMHNVSYVRYIMRKLDDWENPYKYNPYFNVIIVSKKREKKTPSTNNH